MSDNPFDQLGLKKELVTYLHQHGKLDDFLKSYVRLNQIHIHPDRGGNTELSSLVNSAYTTIQQHPTQLQDWLSTMQNGHNEYKDALEALVPEMEQLQKENEALRAEKAASFAAKAGSVDATVRSAPASASAPKPSVRTPPRVDPDVRTPPRATAVPPRTTTPKPAPAPDSLIADKYILMPKTSTYALGIDALRTLGKKPFTFKENILARVEAYESGDQRLFDTWLDSSMGIAYKKGTTKFKLVPHCDQLINIPAGFSQSYLPAEYAKIDGLELNSGTKLIGKTAKYNTSLTKAEIVEHPAWLAAVEGDTALLRAYADIVFATYAEKYSKTDNLMGFYVRQNTATDELRAVFVVNLYELLEREW